MAEAGGINIFVIWRTRQRILRLRTAPLGSKLMLNGVTRRSELQMARDRLGPHMRGQTYTDEQLWGVEVTERAYNLAEVEQAAEKGRLVKVFA